jgi:vanadium chloroperoxidase
VRALAIVHLAMYDAYAGIINNPSNLPPSAALHRRNARTIRRVAGSGCSRSGSRGVVEIVSEPEPFFNLALSGAGDTSDAGRAFGVAVAQKILADRPGDPGAEAGGYVPLQQRGKHRPDPDNPTRGIHAPFYGA